MIGNYAHLAGPPAAEQRYHRLSGPECSSQTSDGSTDTAYRLLPPEADIFAEVERTDIILSHEEQSRFLREFLLEMRGRLTEMVSRYDEPFYLPRLSITKNNDNAAVLSWEHLNFRIFFDFETEIHKSFYGVVAETSEWDTFTRTGKLDTENYRNVIAAVLRFVCQILR